MFIAGGVAAIILGIIGLRKARQPGVGGRGMAGAGIVIGILSILTSATAVTAIFYAFMSATQQPRAVARQFVQDVSAGNTTAAAAEVTNDISPQDLTVLDVKLRPLGTFKDMRSSQVNISTFNGNSTCTLKGTAHFAAGDQTYEIDLTRTGGNWKVSKVEFP
jgi:hypothetical protein